MKLELFPDIFEKYWSLKFHENPSMGAELFHADGHDESKNRFS